MLNAVTIENLQQTFTVFAGSVLPGFYDGKFAIEKSNYSFSGRTILSYEKKNKKNIATTAINFLNSPYLWGGKTVFGIDCSGFTQIVFKLNGIKLPRDAYQQAELGEALNFVEEAQVGDLAFFDNEEGKITHVGIILGPDIIIHASGKVRIDKFDHHGIFHSENKSYSHNLRVVKSFSLENN
jgi:cell wall-associated NlpC family hydrolase